MKGFLIKVVGVVLIVACFGFAALNASVAHAGQGMRCGGHLINPGSTSYEVVKYCGQPHGYGVIYSNKNRDTMETLYYTANGFTYTVHITNNVVKLISGSRG